MNLYQKLATIADEIGTIEKTGKNQHFNYKFIEHAEVTAQVRMAFRQHGVALLISCTGVERDGKKTIAQFAYTLVNADNPEEKEQGFWYGEADDSQDKGLGKAMTMAEKTLIMKLFHISDYDNDEDTDYKPDDKAKTDKPKKQKQSLAQELKQTAKHVAVSPVDAPYIEFEQRLNGAVDLDDLANIWRGGVSELKLDLNSQLGKKLSTLKDALKMKLSKAS